MPAPKKSTRSKGSTRRLSDKMKDVPADKKGLSKLPTEVRNKMGYKAEGGKMQKMAMGGKCRGMGAATRGGNYKMG